MTSILVTGATGFVGHHLCNALLDSSLHIKAAVRSLPENPANLSIEWVVIPTINADTDWREALEGVEVVIHLAARAHIMHETAQDVLQAFRTINTEGSQNLARQAASFGVKRFIFVSTIKVLGEQSGLMALNADSPVNPQDPYGLSKFEAEQALQQCAKASGMEFVIIRPPLLYGAGVKGNFLRLMQWLQRGIPLPLAKINNQRSMVYVENLCDLIRICITHPQAANQILLITDREDFSTSELLIRLATALGKKARLWWLPRKALEIPARWFGKEAEVQRLFDSLQVDASETYRLLSWQPPFSAEQGLVKTAQAFIKRV